MMTKERVLRALTLALLVWVVFNAVGVIKQGPLNYLKNVLVPPGVPLPLYILVTPIEFVSTFLVRPFSLAVRLFANLLAGHILLVTFATLSSGLWAMKPTLIILPLPVLAVIPLMQSEEDRRSALWRGLVTNAGLGVFVAACLAFVAYVWVTG